MLVDQPGIYTLEVSNPCGVETDELVVTKMCIRDSFITDAPPVDLNPEEISICEGETFTFPLDPDVGEYTWEDGSHESEYVISTTGFYWVTLDDGCDITSDGANVIVVAPPPPFTLGGDTTICTGAQISFDFDSGLGDFQWQDNSTSEYYVTVSYTHLDVYKRQSLVNWCPKDMTVLADEQVINGKCERCATVVVKRNLEQWFFRITQYAEQLLDYSNTNFTEITKTLQRNWIGRSEGAQVTFGIADPTHHSEITVFTTRPDTLWGATFLVLAPEHPLITQLTTPEHLSLIHI